MAVNDDIMDAQVSHAVGLTRLATGILRKILRLLNRTDADLEDQIRQRLAGVEPGSIETEFTTERLRLLLEGIRRTNAGVYDQIQVVLLQEALGLAEYEAEHQASIITEHVPVRLDVALPTTEQLHAIVQKRPFQGRLLREWGKSLEDGRTQKVHDAIRIGMVEGETVDQIVRRVRGTKAMGYADGVLQISRRDAESVVRTAVTHIANGASEALYERNSDIIKGVRWVSVLDSRTTAVCRARDGKVYEPGKGPRPPAHWNCLPEGALITTRAPITGASKRWFDGEVFIIRTAAGHELTCTPNHPVLTDRGWVPANFLDQACKVVCDLGAKWPTARVDGEHQDMPSCIEEIADAFLGSQVMIAMPVPTTAEDFHGDGAGSQVAIVGSNSLLQAARDVAFSEHGGETTIIVANAPLADFAREGGFRKLSLTSASPAHGSMRLRCERKTLLGLLTSGPSLLLLGSSAEREAVSEHDPLYGTWRDAEFYRDATDAAPGGVFLDDVVSVERRDFRGHVYNLETENGMFISGGIVTHNCRSTTTPVTKSFRDLGIDLDEVPIGTRASMDGQVPADMTYGQWLARQSAAVQDDILGATKGRLFRDGGLAVDRFVDRAGREYTLDELKRRERGAFRKAGLAA